MSQDLYAVMGHPISHSKSPLIHSLFATQTGEPVEYTAIQCPLDGFADSVKTFFERGGKGLNVTVPFKEQAWNMADVLSPGARAAGAVNTLFRDDEGRLCGENTDGPGLVRDLTVNQRLDLKGARILVLGAGGAVRGIMAPLLQEQPADVVIANRTVAKAEALAELFAGEVPVTACGFRDPKDAFDLIINGTSASLQGDLPPLDSSVVGPETITYDMMYGPGLTPFNQWARDLGAERVIDGLGMLVEQAAEAFACWRGVRPETSPVMAALRDRVG
ncbi:shikimate dehydrogenase [Marinobacter halodurans]|uniref:Shikimate dehydrogenase (NADP(+)) n=1 Tax=Marinobacter halodurans TaxID=2528979 RepID=A0ABY1ZN66_9GAMM|nr:shikimate dehydrogenase [Marinobacter halodurans]TBW56473.1 shikimate dehydrogenase [Marinobacter halodurans]